MEFDPMRHRPIARPIGHRDGPELPQNIAFAKPVVFHSPQVLKEIRKEVENKPVSQYIIWNPTSSKVPTVIHAQRPEAIRVAGRMAHENPGQTFYVCKLVHSAVKPIPVDVKYEDLDR